MGIKILIDSASDINQKEASELGVTLIPMIVSFKDEQYYDGINLLPKDFYEKLIKSEELPKTTQINYYRFKEALEVLTIKGDKVIVITLSSKLSGTYSSAYQAAQKFDGKVYVIDSLSATAGERLLCLYAIKLINENLSFEAIIQELEEVKKRIVVLGVLDTLEFLKKGGRISATTAFVGNLLLIKPAVQLIDGEIKSIAKIKGTKKINDFINSKTEENNIDLNMPHCLLYSGFDDSRAVDYINSNKYVINKNNKNVNIHIVGSTIGTHIGPNVLGVAFFQK